MKETFKRLWPRYNHALLLIYFLIYMPWFGWLNTFSPTRSNATEIYCKLDDLIPFNELFAIPYFIWFAYIAAGFVFFFFNSRKDFFRMAAFLFIGMTTCLIIYMIFPNYQSLRIDYELLGRSNFLTDAIRLLQTGDTPYNVFPSIHCLNSIGMAIAIHKNKWCKDHKWIIIASWILAASICASTVFVKQHSILDFFGAVLLSIPLYLISYVIPWEKIFIRKKA